MIVNDLAKEFEGELECLGENTEKYITFSAPIKKEITKKDKDSNDKIAKISYKTKFIDSFIFMSSSLASLVDNLGDINRKKCDNKCEYIGFKDKNLLVKCSNCNAWFKKDTKEFIKRFANTYNFCNKDLNKLILLLRKGVYPNEYMDNWKRFDETLLPNKEAFYSNLNMEDITDADYRHANKVFKAFKRKNLREYHDLYVQSDNYCLQMYLKILETCVKVYELYPAHFLTAPGLAWQACLKKTDVELELLTDPNMLLMVEEGIRGRMCYAVHRYAKTNNKYMKNYDEKKESSFFEYLDANSLYGWAMCQKLPVGGFKWVKNVSRIDKDFIKNYDKDGDVGFFLKRDI